MPITKRPPKSVPVDDSQVEGFISSAPDGTKKPKKSTTLMRGNRAQISHTMPPEMLKELDKVAKSKGLTRAGMINHVVSEYLEIRKQKT